MKLQRSESLFRRYCNIGWENEIADDVATVGSNEMGTDVV